MRNDAPFDEFLLINSTIQLTSPRRETSNRLLKENLLVVPSYPKRLYIIMKMAENIFALDK